MLYSISPNGFIFSCCVRSLYIGAEQFSGEIDDCIGNSPFAFPAFDRLLQPESGGLHPGVLLQGKGSGVFVGLT